MKRPFKILPVVAGMIACQSALFLQTHAEPQPPTGFTALFNGTDLSGWHGMDMDPRKLWAMSAQEQDAFRKESMKDVNAHWSVEGDELVNDGHGLFLTTEKNYGDYELLLEYKTVADADSGIYLRGVPQVQIWDFTEEGGKWDIGADKGSGGLWNNSPGAPGKDPLVLADNPFGEWNSMRVVHVGSYVTVFMNGKLVVDHALMENYWDRENPMWPKGPIQLQTHGGEIRWRNVFIREIPPTEADVILAEEGFKPIFDGHSLNGWMGPVENYEIVDGAIVCKPNNGGTIYHHQELSDFSVRFEFKLPPGGNNGLAIRYPGSGDTAYAGMCELQVLDDTAEKYAGLDPRQYHGSAYGITAAKRGFHRPVGEWNHQEVTVQGSIIKVVLNGATILDTDVSKVEKFHNDMPHPGINRTSGYFGFAGHGDPVAFRNIRVKALK